MQNKYRINLEMFREYLKPIFFRVEDYMDWCGIWKIKSIEVNYDVEITLEHLRKGYQDVYEFGDAVFQNADTLFEAWCRLANHKEKKKPVDRYLINARKLKQRRNHDI